MQQPILDLVGQIYETVSDQGKWQGVTEQLSSVLGAEAARFRLKSYSSDNYNTISRVGHDDSFDDQYVRHFSDVDPWNDVLERMPCQQAKTSTEMFAEDIFKKTEFYNDFFSRYGVFYAIGAVLVKNESFNGRIGFHRSHAQGDFSEQDKQTLQLFLPHITRAFQLGLHFEKTKVRHDNLVEAFYTASRPLILIDENEQVMFVSQRAETIINQYDAVDIVTNKLHVSMHNDINRLQQLIHHAVLTGKGEGLSSGGGLRVVDAYSDELNLVVMPYRSPVSKLLGSDKRICAIVFIHEPNQQVTLPCDVLRTLYKLSPAEIRLAQGLVNGLSINQVTDELGISVHTARSHLRSIFSKTHVEGQVGLMRLLSGFMGVVE